MAFNLFNFEFKLEGFDLRRLFRRKRIGKETAQILFIDDEIFPVVENLRKAKWSVKRLPDVNSVQDEDIKKSQIIFVDYKGVGRHLSKKEEGIGLIKAIKNEYGSAKRVILYSGYARFSLGEHLSVADNQMSKDSDTYEFIKMIESELKKIQ